MPPSLDVYVVVDRTRSILDSFIDAYVDRAGSEDRGDEQLMMVPLGVDPTEPHGWDWEPAGTLTAAIERGLTQPWRAFDIYLKSRQPHHDGACISFTLDGRAILGVSIDDASEADENLDLAKELLARLASEFSADSGFIGAEEPPPRNGMPRDDGRWLVQWQRDSN